MRITTTFTAAALALAFGASPAFAQTPHSLALGGPSTATVGQPAVMQATGTVSDDPSVFLPRYVNVYAIPTSTAGSCPATLQSAIQLSYATAAQGGDTVANTLPAEGSFSIPVAYTPRAPGRFLLCGYLHEGVGTDATASHVVEVAGAGGGSTGGGSTGGGSTGGDPTGAIKPAIVKKPTLSRSGRKLVCGRGKWSGRPTRYAYQWKVSGKRKKGANGRALRITRKLRGRKVQCVVKAVGEGGSATALSRPLRIR